MTSTTDAKWYRRLKLFDLPAQGRSVTVTSASELLFYMRVHAFVPSRYIEVNGPQLIGAYRDYLDRLEVPFPKVPLPSPNNVINNSLWPICNNRAFNDFCWLEVFTVSGALPPYG